MKARQTEDRDLSATVWSQPPLPSDIIDRRLAAKVSNDRYLKAVRKALA